MTDNLESTHEDFFPDGASNRCRAFHMSNSISKDKKANGEEDGKKEFFIITARVYTFCSIFN